jgi:hypothetical protein
VRSDGSADAARPEADAAETRLRLMVNPDKGRAIVPSEEDASGGAANSCCLSWSCSTLSRIGGSFFVVLCIGGRTNGTFLCPNPEEISLDPTVIGIVAELDNRFALRRR